MKELADDLAAHAAGVRFADLPAAVVEVTKKFVLDTLGASLAGSGAPGCGPVARLIAADGGRKEGTLIVFGDRVPAANAALVNGMLAHAVEFDDTHDATTVHANASVLPAALAMAERTGGVGGEALIEAVAAGVDVTCRLGLGLEGATGWTPAAVFGYFGAALAGGRILGFDAARMHDAIGIVYSQCAGNRQCNVDRAGVKRLQLGFAARAGVQACQLVELGVTGARNVFEGVVGMGGLYFGGKFSPGPVVEGLGKRFLGAELSVKPYPSARPTHGCIDAALSIVEAHDLGPGDVDEVVVHVPYLVMRSGGAPFDHERISQVEAQFSIAYTVSVAIARRGLSLDDFVEETIRKDGQVLDLARRVRVVNDQEPVGPGLTPIVVDIRTRTGAMHSRRTDVIRGHPANPVDMDGVEDKFRRCAAFAARRIPKRRQDRIVAMVRDLDSVADVGALVRLMA